METWLQDPTARTAIMNGTSPKIRQNRLGPLMTLLTKSDQLVTKYANIANICGHTQTQKKTCVCVYSLFCPLLFIFHKVGPNQALLRKAITKNNNNFKMQNIGLIIMRD
jgi:hypothetical protein